MTVDFTNRSNHRWVMRTWCELPFAKGTGQGARPTSCQASSFLTKCRTGMDYGQYGHGPSTRTTWPPWIILTNFRSFSHLAVYICGIFDGLSGIPCLNTSCRYSYS
eukprot:scaffold300344_cov19-Prasinocladus_malaysianus.AAC.1